jgi:hypothetical protein
MRPSHILSRFSPLLMGLLAFTSLACGPPAQGPPDPSPSKVGAAVIPGHWTLVEFGAPW